VTVCVCVAYPKVGRKSAQRPHIIAQCNRSQEIAGVEKEMWDGGGSDMEKCGEMWIKVYQAVRSL
jgi:hypothetical protein